MLTHISQLMPKTFFVLFIILCCFSLFTEGQKRCFKCRSRGDLGSCKDPFRPGNVTESERVAGVEVVPCFSGWCSKTLEGGANTFKDEEYGMATERECMVRPPSDSQERCAPVKKGSTKGIMMCFCQGDLCNSTSLGRVPALISTLVLILPLWFR